MGNIIFLDDNNRQVNEDEATRAIIQKTDEKGNVIGEVIGFIQDDSTRNSLLDTDVNVSPEMQRIMDECKDQDGNYIFRK